MVSAFAVLTAFAMVMPQDNNRNRANNNRQQSSGNNQKPTADEQQGANKTAKKDSLSTRLDEILVLEAEEIPDSLLHPRWQIQRTVPVTVDDLHQNSTDLKRPDNLEQKVEYNDSTNTYNFGYRIGGTYIDAPVSMTLDEYLQYVGRQQRAQYYRGKNDEIFQQKGKEKFDFSDMHFDLGPAEKIFGPGGVRIKMQGTAELKLGATLKSIDNPSLPIRNRNTTAVDFDMKINANVTGSVGDKFNMNFNYNTDATFNFDQQNIKLKYDGKEDEIIKLVELGNVSFPANSSLIMGSQSLFGIRTDMQFGKLKLQTVLSQKKSNSSSVSTKGGVQYTPFEIDVANYEENRHFFLSHSFRSNYDRAMSTLPNLTTGVKINRIEIWVTNKNGATTNTRNIVALTDLGEGSNISNKRWTGSGANVPASNNANTEYNYVVSNLADARNIDMTSTVLDGDGLVGGTDYEKIERARLLASNEYTLNEALGYISLRSNIQTDQVLAVAYEYTAGGLTYQVGEFASDVTDNSKALFVKSLKNTANDPQQGNWPLMMKNVYYLASNIEKEKFRLDVKFQSDTTGVYLSYIPEQESKSTPLIRLLGADRLDNNMKTNPNGYFDFVEGYTVTNGRVFFPAAEPFGSYLKKALVAKGVSEEVAQKYAYDELYSMTKTSAKQIAEKNKFLLQGQFKGSSANVISLGAVNVPRGSVVVTAGGVRLTEGSDYSVDYSAGEVTILNQSIIDAGTSVNVSLESDTDYGQQRKSMYGINWEYDFSKDFQLSGTFRHLSEQSLTTKVSMGSEPLQNTLWGLNLNWKKESQWLTNILDMFPLLHLTAPSSIQLSAEFAHLIAGTASGTQDNASYLDDFENTKNTIDVSTSTSWTISSVPSMFPECNDKTGLSSGFNRSLLAWYSIDPLFTRISSSLTPAHIKGDIQQLSNHYVREVYVSELFPNRDQSSYNGATNTLAILNLAYYPDERGPYNFTTDLNTYGRLNNPRQRWGGMMRKLDTPDFETANVEYIEFWMMDPFIEGKHGYANTQGMGADLYFNLGEVSEDILRDGRKFYESGMPVDGSDTTQPTQWGKVPTQAAVTYAFSNAKGTREKQDVGYNGLTNEEERDLNGPYSDFLNFVNSAYAGNDSIRNEIMNDPAADDYSYFRGSKWDEEQAPIMKRYKRINGPQGNSPDSDSRTEAYDTSYKTTPDVEDINQDYTLNEYEKYYQYHVSIRPEDLVVGTNHIVDKRISSRSLRDGERDSVTWYQFRIPLREYQTKVGAINDFTSIRFMRMFLTNCEKPMVLRFGTLDLVRGEWRVYEQNLNTASHNSASMAVSAVNIEENNDKQPVNYVLPPGISRVVDPSQPQLTENNEQALAFTLSNMSPGDAKCVYKNSTIDMRYYRRLQMFVHANAFENNATNLRDNQLAVFIRLGSDYKSNYYEYEIPLKLTPPGKYDTYSASGCRAVWPQENMLDINLDVFTQLKKERNKAHASYNTEFTAYDNNSPKNKITIKGNPSLGEVKTMIIGVRNLSSEMKSGEVWVNELRLKETENSGGWAAQANMNLQLSDLSTVNVSGKHMSSGFGGLEESVMQRAMEDYSTYSATVSAELGKFFPEKAKVTAPIYYSVTKERTSPKYNPLDTDMKLNDALDAMDRHERDSVENIAVTKKVNTNFSLSNVRLGISTKGHPMPYDPANFSFSYSHSHTHKSGETTVYENEDAWRGGMNYSWSPVFKTFEPFKGIKSKSKYYDILKKFGLNYLPQSIAFNTDLSRSYYELQERDMDSAEKNQLPLTFSQQFLWNRDLNLRWDLTRNIHFQFQSATHAEVEEPYMPVNKDLYPDQYEVWKDSVWTSIKHLGTPLDYSQNVNASFKLPLNLIPIFEWVTADANYSATYNWVRGTNLEDGTSLGNNVAMRRNVSLNGAFALDKLYNQIPFLKKTNERFNKSINVNQLKRQKEADQRKKEAERKAMEAAIRAGKNPEDIKKEAERKKKLEISKRSIQNELTLFSDSLVEFRHNRNSKRLDITAKDENGKPVAIKYKKKDANSIMLSLKGDSTMKVKVTVTKKPELDDKTWYRTAQSMARVLMMLRSVNFSYKENYSMSLPGFMPTVGNAFGQKNYNGLMAPGLDFAFGLTGDDYIERARQNGWLLGDTTVATPATTSRTQDLQIRATLEPFRNFKIDLNASRQMTSGKSVQYMYRGNPTSLNGSFTMTTISLGSAFESIGDATNGFYSKTFQRFCNSLDRYRDKVEAQYANAVYPEGTLHAGEKFNPDNGSVDKYSADVMIPAFLNSYTSMGGDNLGLFPLLTHLLPNWSLRYSGLGQLPWFRDHFKSVNISHAYKSVYAIGAYTSFSTFMEYMDGLGFINDVTTGAAIPNSRYNISQVSINEAFSPLIGIDVTLDNNMTFKAEYRTTRVVNLSMPSVQLSETTSNDLVFGMGYKIQDFNLFAGGSHRMVKGAKKAGNNEQENNTKSRTTSRRNSFSHDLNIRLDISLRKQAAINRDISTMTSTATSGNNAFKLSLMADYTMSRLVTMSFYLNRQTNTPLLSNNSYPTTTQDFGLSLKLSLTR